MPTGEPRASVRGFTYLGLLLVLAVMGPALAALGSSWSLAAQREREAELRFRGEQIREAIARYRQAQEPRQWPRTLDDLVLDRRHDPPRHHLRRLFTDPFTGRVDWVLLAPPAGRGEEPPAGFAGVRSRSERRRLDLRAVGPRASAAPVAAGRVLDAGVAPRVSDWLFVHTETAASQPQPRRSPLR